MFCPYCGSEYDEGFGKCPHCGAGSAATPDGVPPANAQPREEREYTTEGTKDKLTRFVAGKGFLAVAILLTVMTSVSLLTVAGNLFNTLEVTFGVLATVAVWMARSAALGGELKLKKGMLMSLPIYESVWAIVSTVIMVFAAIVMIIVGVVSLSSVDEAQKLFADISAATPTFMGNIFRMVSGVLEELALPDVSDKRVVFVTMFFSMAFSFIVSAVLNLVAGIFMILSAKGIKSVIVAGSCDGELPKNLKRTGGTVIATGVIGLFTSLNSFYFVILIILGVGMRKLAAEDALPKTE